MKPLTTVLLVIVVLVIGFGIYYYWPGPASPAYTQPDNTTAQTGDGTDVTQNLTLGTNATSSLGTYLVAFNGMTVYTFSKDTTGTTTCYGQCAVNWPPYTVPAGTNLTGESPIDGTIDVIARADGQEQVTYKGMPLYFYIKDKAPGDTTGQNVGGVWFVGTP